MMIDPLLPVWIILTLLTGLLAWSATLEWRRPLRFRLLRMTACLVAVSSLAVIFLRPSRQTRPDKQAILLTSSYSHTVVDSLLRTNNRAALYHLGAVSYRQSQPLSSYRSLFRTAAPPFGVDTEYGNVGSLYAVVGEGLPPYALDSLPGGFNYFPAPPPDGIAHISLPYHNPQRNHPATIRGAYRTSGAPATLYFSGPGGKLDSMQLMRDTGPFSFSFTPRASGRMTYLLTLVDRSGNRIEERVPIPVDANSPLNLFMLQDYPTFEMQHLKNFLSDRGHRIAVRAQLSRNTYRTEFTNRSATSLSKITPTLLHDFDLLIVDANLLVRLPGAERSAIEDALKDGMGMIVLFNGAPEKLPGKDLLPIRFTPSPTDTTSVVVGGKRIALPATPLKPAPYEGTIITRDASRALSGFVPIRKGMAGFQLLRETYSLLLAGDSVSYGSLWSPLIESMARTGRQSGGIQVVSEFPLAINEPVTVDLISDSTPALFADSVQIPVSEDPLIDGLWHATIWPTTEGWHSLRTQTDTSSYYIFSHADWKAMRIDYQQAANRMAANRNAPAGTDMQVMAPISLVPFWLTFLVAAGFLWLAPKL